MAFKGLISSASLLGSFHDGPIYRHEIGMDSFGRLRPGNPIVRVHAAMLAVHGAILLSGIIFGWRGLLAASAGVQALLALLVWPTAYRKAFLSMFHDRTRGVLEQLWLTRLSSRQLLEGKYYGTLAPFSEVRRHMRIIAFFIFIGGWGEAGPVGAVGMSMASLVLVNHFGISCTLGVLGGIRAGAATTRLGRSMMRERACNPWAIHLYYLLRSAVYTFFIGIPLGLVLVPFLLTIDILSGVPALGLYVTLAAILIPMLSAGPLMDYHRKVLDETAKNFRRLLNFEAGV